MAEKMNGLSLDFIIHPGETLKEVLEEKQMSQEELAIRTGFSPKHVSEVVNGKKGISPSFARSLEYVFGIPTSFWINLQGIYDKEMLEYKEQEEIDENEVEIVKKLKKVIEYAEEQNVMNKTKDVFARIIELRNICNVKNLTYINNLVTSQVAFRKSQTLETNVYVLYVWLRICDIIAEKNTINEEYDEQKLMNNIEKIKDCMFLEINEAIKKLKETGKFNKLNDNLKEIANLRLENPDMPLIELGKKLRQPVGKSGVNYRLKKIMELANE